MICMIINNEEAGNHLYITRNFCGAHTLLDSKTLSDVFKRVRLFETRRDALDAAADEAPEKVFIDSDIGLKPVYAFRRLKARSKNTRLCVYEEGIGTYRTDLIRSRTKRVVYCLFGAARYLGGSTFTDEVYVFDADLYRRKHPGHSGKVVGLSTPLASWVMANKCRLVNIFGPVAIDDESVAGDAVSLYLTGWEIDFDLIENMSREGWVYVKPHPHIRGDALGRLEEIKGIKVIPGLVPAELLIVLLMERFDKVKICHCGSSSIHYMSKTLEQRGFVVL